jgi:hypothetical protein
MLLASLYPKCFGQIINDDDSLRQMVKQYGQARVIVPYVSLKESEQLSRKVSILAIKEKQIEICLSPLTVEWFIRQKFPYTTEKSVTKTILSATSMRKAMEWDTYPTFTQYDSIMKSFITDFPSLCQLDTIGTSINGKLVFVLKISDNPEDNENEPDVFYTAGIHGDETGGFILMLHLIDYILENYNSPEVKNMVDNLEIWINPLSNPDGTYGTGDIISSPVRFNANGVDLNRDFPDPLQPNPARQKETIDMIDFLDRHRFAISANFHSGAEVVNYPWDRWLSKFHADDSWFNTISRAYADTVHIYSDPEYMDDLDNGVTRGAVWYVIYGGRQDFVTYDLHGREVTIEIDDQYVTSPSRLELLWEYNRRSLIGYLKNALYGIQGKVINAGTSEPVSAKIFISGHDKDSSYVYSDDTGNYIRMLSPGLWDLTFSAPGFSDKVITGISVSPYQKTELNVSLEPVDTIVPEKTVLYPNPAKTEISALLLSDIAGNINVKIYSAGGSLISDYNTTYDHGTPIKINLKNIAAGTYSVIFLNRDKGISYKGRFIVIK